MLGANLKPVRPVRFPLPLIPGESIRGYVGRIAEYNTYDKPTQLLEAVGIGLGDLWKGNVDLGALTCLYNVDALEYALPRYVGDGPTLTVQGVTYPKGAIRETHCPVSPTSLRRSSHHRFAWSLRAFSFCPEDYTLLLFKCPAAGCGRQLMWRDGPFHRCAGCGLDLSTARTRKIYPKHRAYLAVAAGLVSFDEQVRRRSLDQLPDFLNALTPFEVLQVVLTIGRALEDARHPLARVKLATRRYPVAMLAGMRLLLDQPGRTSFGLDVGKAPPAYIARAREKLRQAASIASAGQREALIRLRDENPLFQSPRAATHATNLTIAARRLGVGRNVAKALLDEGVLRGQAIGGGSDRVLSVVEEASLADLIGEAQSRVSAGQLAEQYSLKSSWILEMAALGLIERATHPFIAIAYKNVQLRKSSAIAYLDRITGAIVRTSPDDSERVLLRDVFVLMGPGPKPWLQAVMAPKFLPDGLGSFEPHGINCSALNVTRNCARLLQSGAFQLPPTRLPTSGEITLTEAQEHLNCHPRDIAELIKVGALLRSGRGVCMQSVQTCGHTLISTGELAARAQMSSMDFAPVAEQRGLRRPHQNVGFWDRRQAEAAFDLPNSRLHLVSLGRPG